MAGTATSTSPTTARSASAGCSTPIRENEFALQTFEFDGAPDEVALEFMWFEDLGDGRTRLRGRSIGRTVEGRDAMVESGMEKGMVEGYDRLETLVGG